MATLRALGATLAEKFGRKADIGLELVRQFQLQGYFEVGERGRSEVAPQAHSAHRSRLDVPGWTAISHAGIHGHPDHA